MEADSFMYFHQINAYEDQGYVIVDISCHQDSKIIDAMYMKNLTSKECEEILKEVANPQARRYVIPLNPQTKESTAEYIVQLENTSARCKKVNQNTYHCEPEVLADINLEFPQINYAKYNTKKYRYIYGVSVSPDEAIVKVDANTKSHVLWKEERCYPSEPVFIAEPGGTAEDDGVLVAAVNRAGQTEDENSCFLLVLDAKTFTEIARAEFEGVERFPKDFHGVFTYDQN